MRYFVNIIFQEDKQCARQHLINSIYATANEWREKNAALWKGLMLLAKTHLSKFACIDIRVCSKNANENQMEWQSKNEEREENKDCWKNQFRRYFQYECTIHQVSD